MDIYGNMKNLNITLPDRPAKGGIYVQAKRMPGNLVYISGCGPDINGTSHKKGKLGADLTIEEGQEAARCCILNILSIIEGEFGGLHHVKSFAKLLVFVSSNSDFYMQPKVADGASQLLIDIFGEEIGCAARSAIGVNVLPGNIPVEIEALIELDD